MIVDTLRARDKTIIRSHIWARMLAGAVRGVRQSEVAFEHVVEPQRPQAFVDR